MKGTRRQRLKWMRVFYEMREGKKMHKEEEEVEALGVTRERGREESLKWD